MQNATPYEILAAPFTLWRAPALTNRPTIDQNPGVDWIKVGSNGDLNYTEEGVTIELPQSTLKIRSAGDTGARKIVRLTEDFMVRLVLMDTTLQQIKLALNGNPLTNEASGTKRVTRIGLSRGPHVETYALLLRGPSPYLEDGIAQFWIPIACENGNPTVALNKQGAAGWALAFDALVNSAAASADQYFGIFEAETLDTDT